MTRSRIQLDPALGGGVDGAYDADGTPLRTAGPNGPRPGLVGRRDRMFGQVRRLGDSDTFNRDMGPRWRGSLGMDLRSMLVSLPIGYVVPVDRENRWSDLLAVLIESDPIGAGKALGVGDMLSSVRVEREALAGARDRIDMLVYVHEVLRAVIEVKVLSGLGVGQLARYHEAFLTAVHHILFCPERLPVDISDQPCWQGLTWERVLGCFATSERAWVAETAQAWLEHLARAVPIVDGHTRWNDLRAGEDFVIAVRARMSWVFGQLRPPEPVTHDLVSSAAGVSWVTRMYLPAAVPGYDVIAEAEENLPVRDYPKKVTATSTAVRGPSIKVCLRQRDVATSAGFDWDYLLALWPTMQQSRSDWVTAPARPRAAHDRAGWTSMLARGGPRHLGIGFGEAQARTAGECMFGARFQLPANVELHTVVECLHQTAQLIHHLAAIHPHT